jgi:hypothetical protein
MNFRRKDAKSAKIKTAALRAGKPDTELMCFSLSGLPTCVPSFLARDIIILILLFFASFASLRRKLL